MHITEIDVQSNLHNNDNRKENEESKDAQKKNIINKSEQQKRKNKLTDGDDPISKKMKTDNTAKEDLQIKANINNIKVENNNKKLVAINKSLGKKKNKNRNSQFNQLNTRKRKPDYDPTMSLNAERLKTYGINAKKLKNKLKYGNKTL